MCANKLPYLSGYYAKTSSRQYVLDTAFTEESRNIFKQHVLTYKPDATFEELPVTAQQYQEGKRVYIRNDEFSGNAGYTYFAGAATADSAVDRVVDYSSAVVICANIPSVMIHEDGHCDGLAHEDLNYRWIFYQRSWRNTQQYQYGNLNAGGFMAYGGKSFTPVDDWDLKRINGISVTKGRVKGNITINGQPLKGANLIFISRTKRFQPDQRKLPLRFSTIVDILGDGDGSFDIELPPDTYQVMLVPIGVYSRGTHGIWRFSDSQIAGVTKPLFLNTRRKKFLQNISTVGTIKIVNGRDLTFNWAAEV